MRKFRASFQYPITAIILLIMTLFWVASAASAEPFRIALSKTPLSLPFYVAQSLGYFAHEGVELEINEVTGGHLAMQQVLKGEADLSTSSEAVVMFSSFKSSDFAVIASFVSSNDDVKIITHADSGIGRPAQLAGKLVGTVSGSAGHYYLETTVLLNGINPKEVRLRNLRPEEMVDALKNQEVAAISIWEPYPYKALKEVPGAKMLARSNIYRLTFNLVAHKKLLGSRDDELGKILRALDRAEQFINAEPQQAKAILMHRLKLDQSFIDWIWPSYHYQLTLDQSLLTTLESEARWARQEGLVKMDQSPNYLDFIYTGPLSKVRATAVSIIK